MERWISAYILAALMASTAFTDIMKTERRFEQKEIPAYWKSRVEDVEEVMGTVTRGDVRIVATTPGERVVYLVSYGEPKFDRSANYNSAVAARKPECFADKDEDLPPTVFIVGPPHGQEIENIVGILNLIRVAETGSDFRGKAWPELRKAIGECRLLLIPLANPDGRARCPYDSFVGIPVDEMTRVGQGTREDGTNYGWPGAKRVHPMRGDVGFLGAYFNDDGINLMHDEFFDPMAKETKALLDIARGEAADYVINLHSHGQPPAILHTAYVPWFHNEIEYQFAERLMKRYKDNDLPAASLPKPRTDGQSYPPPSFNLTSALHHVCGGVSMLFECCHGLKEDKYPDVTHDQLVDIQLILFEELLKFAIDKPRPYMHLQE